MIHFTGIGNPNSISRPQEILSKRIYGSTIADSNWSIIAVGVVVDGFLVVLQLSCVFSELLLL